MSMTKNSAAFDLMMQQERERHDHSYEAYQEEMYYRARARQRFPADDEQPEKE